MNEVTHEWYLALLASTLFLADYAVEVPWSTGLRKRIDDNYTLLTAYRRSHGILPNDPRSERSED